MLTSIPNVITLSRLVLAVLFAYLLFAAAEPRLVLACFVLAAVSDWVDGYLARRLRQATPKGAVLDQMIDRAFTLIVVISMLAHSSLSPDAEAFYCRPAQELWILLFLTCSREICSTPGLLFAAWRRKPLYNVEYIGKVTTFLQSVALGALLLGADWALYLAVASALAGVLAAWNYTSYAFQGARWNCDHRIQN
ncbi:MAG: CDP-alcohol phosphatidyltransferase family protein [Planctomycetota bacterium]